MKNGLSPVHRIIAAFSSALDGLHLGVPPLFIERWGVAVHQALSSRAREFHTHDHVLEMIRDADPLETIAALYHDTVYVQVDLDVPEHFESLLAPLIHKEAGGGWRILPHTGVDPVCKDVLDVFGRKSGEVLTASTGLNELASALVAARELEGVLSREQLLAVAVCIEATIPFRDGRATTLQTRLDACGISAEESRVMLQRATRVANNDVGNFAEAEPERFLDNTWKLLPETNPSLLMPTSYSVHEYRVALMKMEGFLSKLPAERVFMCWGGEPTDEQHTNRVQKAANNIALAVRYLRAKLYSSTLIEALAMESGGDAPLDLFMGGIPDPNGPPMRRLEAFLPTVSKPAADHDPEMQRLLEGGRATASSFDTSPSPLASFLYSSLGEAKIMTGVEDARLWWKGELTAMQFLERQSKLATGVLAAATGNTADTRKEALDLLAKRFS